MSRTSKKEEALERYDRSKEADVVRQACKNDLRFFYLNVLDQHKRGVGRLHDYLFDFLRIHELKDLDPKFQHTSLSDYLTLQDNGWFEETWMYWPTLDSEPEVHVGSGGAIEEMFQNGTPWRGLIIRLAGTGHDKCILLPRGHLKSTIATEAHTLWEIIRNPSLRHLIRCASQPLARAFVNGQKYHFEANEQFQRLFGNLGPTEEIWRQDELQVNTDKRIGKEFTIMSKGMNSEVTGFHYDRIKLDDPVVEKNSATPELREQIKLRIQRLQFVRDPGSFITDIGTIWSTSDAHSIYIRPDGESYKRSSFMVATVRDAEERPIWPEVFTEEVIQQNRDFCQSDFEWYSQYYNQPFMASAQKLDERWIQQEPFIPERKTIEDKLDIVITVDPANSLRKKSDWSACTVQGQTPNGQKRYLLDGFRDRLGPDELPQVLSDIGCKWQSIAAQAGTSFKFAIESHSFQSYVGVALKNINRSKGRNFAIDDLKHAYRTKEDRIKALAQPYSTGSIIWPNEIPKTEIRTGRDYDLCHELRKQYIKFPDSNYKDDLLDAQAYAEDIFRPLESKHKQPKMDDGKPFSKVPTRQESLEEAEREDATFGRRGRYFPSQRHGKDNDNWRVRTKRRVGRLRRTY